MSIMLKRLLLSINIEFVFLVPANHEMDHLLSLFANISWCLHMCLEKWLIHHQNFFIFFNAPYTEEWVIVIMGAIFIISYSGVSLGGFIISQELCIFVLGTIWYLEQRLYKILCIRKTWSNTSIQANAPVIS